MRSISCCAPTTTPSGARACCIHSPEGDFQVRPRCARRPEEIGPADLVLIGLKTTANDQFPRLLPPLVGPATAVLTLQNGLGNEEQLARLFPVEQIMGGLCFVCLNRVAPGVIRHIGYGQVVLGEFQRPPEPRTHDLAARFARSRRALHRQRGPRARALGEAGLEHPLQRPGGRGAPATTSLDALRNRHSTFDLALPSCLHCPPTNSWPTRAGRSWCAS